MSETLRFTGRYIAPALAAFTLASCGGGEKNHPDQASIQPCPQGYILKQKPVTNPSAALRKLSEGAHRYTNDMADNVDSPGEALCSSGGKLYYSPDADIVIGAIEAGQSLEKKQDSDK